MIYFILLGTVFLVAGYFYGLYNIKRFFKTNFYDLQKKTSTDIEWHNLKYKELEERLDAMFEELYGLKEEEPVDCTVKEEKPKYNVSDYKGIDIRPKSITTFGIDELNPYRKFFVQFVFKNNDKDYDTRFSSQQKVVEAYNFITDKERFTDVLLWFLSKFDNPIAAIKLLDIDVSYLEHDFNHRQTSEVLKEYFTVDFEEVISELKKDKQVVGEDRMIKRIYDDGITFSEADERSITNFGHKNLNVGWKELAISLYKGFKTTYKYAKVNNLNFSVTIEFFQDTALVLLQRKFKFKDYENYSGGRSVVFNKKK